MKDRNVMEEIIHHIKEHICDENRSIVEYLIQQIKEWNEDCTISGIESLKTIEERCTSPSSEPDMTLEKIRFVLRSCFNKYNFVERADFVNINKLRIYQSALKVSAKEEDFRQTIWYYMQIQTLCGDDIDLVYSAYSRIVSE